jgi:hypothetical protein
MRGTYAIMSLMARAHASLTLVGAISRRSTRGTNTTSLSVRLATRVKRGKGQAAISAVAT